MSDSEEALVPERILELSERLSTAAATSIGEIARINREAKMLAINALITAARAGEAGRGFSVVAEEFKQISSRIDEVTADLQSQVQGDLRELSAVGGAILGHLRGQRLADLALNAIEIIDRNLYERTCDVRWWATDSAVVDCAAAGTDAAAEHASGRLKVILDAYTVYLDLWICDAQGRVIATGRPERYPRVAGSSVANAAWFKNAKATASGQDFVACDVERAALLNDAPVATYAAAIRRNGAVNGEVIGVLGIHFDWQPQAHAVVDGVRLTDEERQRSRVLLLDRTGRVLASSDRRGELADTFSLPASAESMGSYAAQGVTVGYALTPGYETYEGLGWYGCIVQDERVAATETVRRANAA
ncbi:MULTISPECIES: methyl-accepting chemotaxis protein [unclassified Phenylobacterium]|uniref:methyl-accepting chemotaxis protein n=1 Tax=unclassified Phenylobacterium TaxID=2640670 RepID=UPI00083B9134|nr:MULTISPECIES: methyl-accepting chemotaxis protein [unclassified Phenylobacterium]